MKRWRFHQDVLSEVEDAAHWYQDQRPGLGDEFIVVLDEVFAALERGPVLSSPEPEDPRTRRVFVPRFPYAIVFVETDEEFFVVAVAHLKRRPGYWRHRIEDQ
jgi:hypothetical protein